MIDSHTWQVPDGGNEAVGECGMEVTNRIAQCVDASLPEVRNEQMQRGLAVE